MRDETVDGISTCSQGSTIVESRKLRSLFAGLEDSFKPGVCL